MNDSLFFFLQVLVKQKACQVEGILNGHQNQPLWCDSRQLLWAEPFGEFVRDHIFIRKIKNFPLIRKRITDVCEAQKQRPGHHPQ